MFFNKKNKMEPSKRGKNPSHCSRILKWVEKVDDLTLLFNSLEKCSIGFYKLIIAVFKILKIPLIIKGIDLFFDTIGSLIFFYTI